MMGLMIEISSNFKNRKISLHKVKFNYYLLVFGNFNYIFNIKSCLVYSS